MPAASTTPAASASRAPRPSDSQETEEENGSHALDRRKTTPLPWRQLGVLILMRFAEPIAFTQVFPYINRMVLEIGAARSPAEVGFYGGLIESLFALTQLCTVLAWGTLSDRIGRKKVMLIGLTGTTLSQLAFGFSKSFAWAVVARCLAGALNGNVAIIKSMLGELTDSTNQARAFSFLPLCWAVGCTIGPLIGGYLSHPEEQFPGWFGEHGEHGSFYLGGLWLRYPYLLPCLIAASSTTLSILLGIFFLEETLPSIVAEKKERKRQAAAALQSADDDASTRPLLGSTAPSYGTTWSGTAPSTSSAPAPASTAHHNQLSQQVHDSFSDPATNGRGTSKSLPGGFARVTRGRSRIRVGQVQSWFSGFTPTGSRTVSRAGSPGPESHERSSLLAGERENGLTAEPAAASAANQPNASQGDEKKGIMHILSIGHIQNVLLSYSFLALSAVSIDAVLVLYLYLPISLGGLSFTSQQTGTLLFLSGLGSVFVQLLLFPFCQKRVGTLGLYRLSLCAFPTTALMLPIANLVALSALPSGADDEHKKMAELLPPQTQALVWMIVIIASMFRMTSSMSFSCNMLLVNQSAFLVKGAKLGTLNGLAQMSSSITRAIGPYAASSLFAFSVERKLLDGKLIWLILIVIGVLGVIIASNIKDLEGRIRKQEEEAAEAQRRIRAS